MMAPHPRSAEDAGTRFASETLSGFRDLGVEPIVIGGWALRLYGSPVFSIDLDILVPDADLARPDVHDFVEARADHHRRAHEDSYLEVGALEWPNRLWVRETAFRPADLIARYGVERRRAAHSGHVIEADVPHPDALVFLKTKAMCNRANKLSALRDPRRLAGLFADQREGIENVRPAFLIRKVAKDLVDVAYLAQGSTGARRAADVADHVGLRRDLAALIHNVTPDLVAEAFNITREFGLDLPVDRVLADLAQALKA